MPSVFISYSAKDKEFAAALAALLRTYGDSVFLADDSIEAGEDDWAIMLSSLATAEIIVLAATPNACASAGVRREMMEAKRLNKKVIPLMKGITPEQLKERMGDVLVVKQGVPIDDPVKWQAFLNQFGKKVGKGNVVFGVVIGVAATLALIGYLASRSKKK